MPAPAQHASLQIGDIKVSYLPDGFSALGAANVFPSVDWTGRSEYLDDQDRVVLSFGSFLVRAGGRNILVDLALGDLTADVPGLGHLEGGALLRNLAQEGLSPAGVDVVLYTHLHLDHVGWTSDVAPNPALPTERAPSGLTFANARHLVSEPEWRHWYDDNQPGGPDRTAVLDVLADQIEFVADGDELAPGVCVRLDPGHSPGHLEVLIKDVTGDSSDSLTLIGDILHSPAQIADPSMAFASESDPTQALAVRKALLDSPPTYIGAEHFADQVFGRIDLTDSGPVWRPLSSDEPR